MRRETSDSLQGEPYDLVSASTRSFLTDSPTYRITFRRFFLAYVKFQLSLDLDEPAVLRVRPLYVALTNVFGNGHNLQAKETALSTLGLLGQTVEDEGLLQKISSQLVSQLAEPDPWLKAQAHCAVRPPVHGRSRFRRSRRMRLTV